MTVIEERFSKAPQQARQLLNDLLKRIPNSSINSYWVLKNDLSSLGELTLTPADRDTALQRVERAKQELAPILGKDNMDFLIRGLVTDVDPDVQ